MLCHRSEELPQRLISRMLCATPFLIAALLSFVGIQLPVGSDSRVACGIATFAVWLGGMVPFGYFASVYDEWKNKK